MFLNGQTFLFKNGVKTSVAGSCANSEKDIYFKAPTH